jgi:hypothetical protein
MGATVKLSHVAIAEPLHKCPLLLNKGFEAQGMMRTYNQRMAMYQRTVSFLPAA